MTIWRMRIARWITEATNTLSEYVIFIAFPLQQCLEENASKLRYTHIARLVFRLSLKVAVSDAGMNVEAAVNCLFSVTQNAL
jgi:hypothetical protein